MNQFILYVNERQINRNYMYAFPPPQNPYFVPFFMRKNPRYQPSNAHFNSLLDLNELLRYTQRYNWGYIFHERSLLFQDCHMYKEAINNMHLAEIYDCKVDFTERRNYCLFAIKCKQQVQLVGDNRHYFSLTYPRNPQLPFIVSCLKLVNNPIYGNHIITTEDLYPGNVICIENQLFGTLAENYHRNPMVEDDTFSTRCSHCFVHTMDLISCTYCFNAMFCSLSCREEACKMYHNYECIIYRNFLGLHNIVRKLHSFFVTLHLYDDNIDDMKKDYQPNDTNAITVFDLNLNGPMDITTQRALMQTFNTCKSPKKTKFSKHMTDLIKEVFHSDRDLLTKWIGNEAFIMDFIRRHNDNLMEHGQVILDFATNTTQFNGILHPMRMGYGRKIIGTGFYPFASLMKHAQKSNVLRHLNKHNQLVMIVSRPIKRGEILFDDYNKHFFINYQKK